MWNWLKKKTERSESHQQSSSPKANSRAADLPPRRSEMPTTSKWWKAEDIAVKWNNRGEKGLAEIMRQMRLKILNAAPSDFDRLQTQEFPHVWGLVMDSPLPAGITTLVCFTTGDASIYTTTSFGVLGGIAHQNVRKAVENCIKVTQQYYEDAMPTKEYPYPTDNQVNFYLIGYDGVRMIRADLKAVGQIEDKCSALYLVAHKVITEIRLIAQPEMEKRLRS